jgi:hypothetical protein
MKIEVNKGRLIVTVEKTDVLQQCKIEDFYVSIKTEQVHLEFNFSEKTAVTFISYK